ncbi:MAG: 4Fe-4S dicluster domain-containing protein [Nitrospirae bacterium]|nr:MAG: 4Fe-4S dicluster domain-containing protein [Nitrospirota bacterium]
MAWITRRQFIKELSGLFLVGFLPFMRTDLLLRPPGARRDFLQRCIRCGKCIEACPYDSIRFPDITSGGSIFTPYIDPLKTPCYLCQQRGPDGIDRPISKYLRCGDACPTGALKRIVNTRETLERLPDELKMGISVINRKLCLAWQYDSCGECYYNCPLKDKALRDRPPGEIIEGATGVRPYVDPDFCVGCGMCNYVCPVKERIARSYMDRSIKLSFFEERYAAMVRNVIGRAGNDLKLPAIRVQRVF